MGAVAEQPGLEFCGLLRQLRRGAQLTQEELAEAAGISPRSVSDLERGIHHTARKDTAVLLAGALGLTGLARALFVTAALGRGPAAQVLAALRGDAPAAAAAVASRTLPRDTASFTGRERELARLVAAITPAATGGGVVSVHAINGMAGIGKTTLAVHAAHRMAGAFPDGQMFLPLHAHTAGQRPVDPADALASLLLAAGIPAGQVPAGLDARAGRWRDYLAGRKVLLVLDDAAGHEQVRPMLPGTAGSLVLITSRRRLTALEDAVVISLDTLPADEAAALLMRLAGRPGLSPGDVVVGAVTRMCGYLPLAIGMLARQLQHHPAWTASGLAAELAGARDRLELMQAENLSVAAAFDLSYRELTAGQQRLFRALGLHPGPDTDAYAAAALCGTSLATARRQLDGLYSQHLISEPAQGRYRFHDLLREHARTLAAADDPEVQAAATGRMLSYYAHTAYAASQHIPRFVASDVRPPPGPPPACAPPMHSARQAFAWLAAERANLHAATVLAASASPADAVAIPDAMDGFMDAMGYWDEAGALHQIALSAARQSGDRPGQARALMLVAGQGMTGDIAASIANIERALALFRELGDKAGQADCLNARGRMHGSDFPAATACHDQALALFHDIGHRRGESDTLSTLGVIRGWTGHYAEAAACHQQALGLHRDIGHRLGEACALIQLGIVARDTGNYPAAAGYHQQALAIFTDLRDSYKQAFTQHHLGILQRLTADYPAAAASQRKALKQFLEIGQTSAQAAAINEIGLLQHLAGDDHAAAASCQHALTLYRGDSNRGGQAAALNSLGEIQARSAPRQQARDYHSQALAIARDIGVPVEEARALEGIGRCHLQDGHRSEGTSHLQAALTIYQRIGSPAAQPVQETLDRSARRSARH